MTVQGRMIFPSAASDQALRDAMQWPAAADSTRHGCLARPVPSGICVDPDKTGDDLIRLVLALMETIRQLVERQAIRRVDSGSLSEEEVERLGLALLRLEERMTELKEHFGLGDDDLALRLGPLHELVDGVRRG